MRKVIFSVIAICILSLSSCRESKHAFANFTGFIQGSTYSIVYENKKNLDAGEVRQKVEKILNDFDMSLSLYQG